MSSCHVSREYRLDDIIDLFYGYVNKHVFKRIFEFWFKAEKNQQSTLIVLLIHPFTQISSSTNSCSF